MDNKQQTATITLEVSHQNECTRAPFWIIIDPHALEQGSRNAFTGLFFSRKEATDYICENYYSFSPEAYVYCYSGWRGKQYDKACDDARIGH